MPTLQVFSADELPHVAWPSGAGSSCELVLWPDPGSRGAAEFSLRVSIESTDRTGPMPSLPGYEHLVGALGDVRLQLDHGGAARDTYLRRGETGSFQGDWATGVSALDGPASFLSICTPGGRARVTLQILRLGQRELREPQTSRLSLLYVSQGEISARITNEEDPIELYAGYGVFIADGRTGDEWALAGATPDSEFVWAQIDFS